MSDKKKCEQQAEKETVIGDIDLLKEELVSLEDRLLRAIAEAENIRKIAAKEKTDIMKYGISKFAKDVLSIRDNLKLALSNSDASTDHIIEGVKLTMAVLDKTLESNGVTIIEAVDCKFDPHFHQAVVEIEDDEKQGLVVQVLQDGFMIYDRLLRPALVAVAKKK